MKYIPLDDFKRAWIFKHHEMRVSDGDLESIKPLSETYASDVWRRLVSEHCDHPDHFGAGDWADQESTWQLEGHWQECWESDALALPDVIANFIDWDINTVVYFCYDSSLIIETTWAVFQRCWKNFLFFDDGPVLVGKKRQQVMQFFDEGRVRLGKKPK